MYSQLAHWVVPGALLITVVFIGSLIYDTRQQFEMGRCEYNGLSWLFGVLAFIGLLSPMMTTDPQMAVTGLGAAAVFGFLWLACAVASGNPGPLFGILIRVIASFIVHH